MEQAEKLTAEEMLAKMEALKAEVEGYRNQARAARNTAREVNRLTAVQAAQRLKQTAAAAWPVGADDIPPFPAPYRANDAGALYVW